jgi:REP element-mobilizing transposase RayT
VVTGSLFRGVELGHYQLGAFVLMANPVHVLLRPLILPSRLRKSLKGYTAREANRLLGRTGEPFWQRSAHETWQARCSGTRADTSVGSARRSACATMGSTLR